MKKVYLAKRRDPNLARYVITNGRANMALVQSGKSGLLSVVTVIYDSSISDEDIEELRKRFSTFRPYGEDEKLSSFEAATTYQGMMKQLRNLFDVEEV